MPTRYLALWQSAGFTDDQHRLYERRVHGGEIWIPNSVEVDAADVIWRGSSREGPIFRRPGSELIDRFLRLADATPAKVAAFVRECGPLSLLDTGKREYGSLEQAAILAAQLTGCEIETDELERYADGCWIGSGREPVEYYKGLSAYVHGLLTCAAELYAFAEDDPRWLDRFPRHDDLNAYGIDAARMHVEVRIAHLLTFAGSSFGLEWVNGTDGEGARWDLIVTGRGVFSAIAVHSALMITRSDLYLCAGCGIPYTRSPVTREGETRAVKRPKPGQRNYCQACRKDGDPVKHAKQRLREKIRTARELQSNGVAIEEISTRLSSPQEKVLKWIGGLNEQTRKR